MMNLLREDRTREQQRLDDIIKPKLVMFVVMTIGFLYFGSRIWGYTV